MKLLKRSIWDIYRIPHNIAREIKDDMLFSNVMGVVLTIIFIWFRLQYLLFWATSFEEIYIDLLSLVLFLLGVFILGNIAYLVYRILVYKEKLQLKVNNKLKRIIERDFFILVIIFSFVYQAYFWQRPVWPILFAYPSYLLIIWIKTLMTADKKK